MPSELDRVFERLRAMNEPVPSPPPLPSPRDVSKAETSLGVTFHPDFKRYLLEASDINFGSKELVTLTLPESHTDLIRVTEDGRKYLGLPNDHTPICEDNGDLYCVTPSGEVVFWPHDSTSNEKWPGLVAWIEEVWIDGQ